MRRVTGTDKEPLQASEGLSLCPLFRLPRNDKQGNFPRLVQARPPVLA